MRAAQDEESCRHEKREHLGGPLSPLPFTPSKIVPSHLEGTSSPLICRAARISIQLVIAPRAGINLCIWACLASCLCMCVRLLQDPGEARFVCLSDDCLRRLLARERGSLSFFLLMRGCILCDKFVRLEAACVLWILVRAASGVHITYTQSSIGVIFYRPRGHKSESC